jgi:YegS/Rv2252/BmrU family lipid kinase
MKPSADIRVIINPASAACKTARRIPAIVNSLESRFPGRCAIALTQGPGDAVRIAGEAVRSDISLVVAVGGDGTFHEVANGMLRATGGKLPSCPLGFVSSGSGQGFALSLRLPPTLEEQVRLLAEVPARAIDVGVVSVRPPAGEWSDHFFVNECQIGIGADVVRSTHRTGKAAGGLLGYGLATFSALFRSPNAEVWLTIDDGEELVSTVLGLAIGNGDLTGGGMALTPGAEPDDGVLNLLTIHGLSLAERLRSFPKIYSGAHIGARGFSYRAVKRCRLSGPVPLPVAADGEMIGRLPATISVLERTLLVIAPAHNGETTHEHTLSRIAEARV